MASGVELKPKGYEVKDGEENGEEKVGQVRGESPQ